MHGLADSIGLALRGQRSIGNRLGALAGVARGAELQPGVHLPRRHLEDGRDRVVPLH